MTAAGAMSVENATTNQPRRGIVAIRTWGDKCYGPRFEWELISLSAPTRTLRWLHEF